MKRKQIQSVMLLGYLVFFLNLGPSFHRAPIFGLHEHGPQPAVECSCGHVHETLATEQPENDHGKRSINKRLCDCSLCKFFKQYHADIHVGQQLTFGLLVDRSVEEIASIGPRLLVCNFARGPPNS